MKTTTLYIIHGWTYTVAPWTRTIELLEKKGIKVEMLHVPGLTSPSKKVWTIEEYVKWADRRIPKGAIALGHSNGGRILLNLCAEKPDKLSHLILLDAAGVYEVSGKRDFARNVSKKLQFLKSVPGLTKVWHKLTGATDYARAPENMKRTLANMLDSDKQLNLHEVTTLTSILWGAEDTVTPPRQAEVMHQAITRSTLEIFPDWTHAPYISHPDALARAIYKTIKHPPKVQTQATAKATAKSAALALKKAPEPVMEVGEQNPVAPNVPTKLVLRKGDSKITEGLKVSDAEGAAVKYQPKKTEVDSKIINAVSDSASANIKKAQSDKAPDLDVAAASASANIKKTSKRIPDTDASTSSAALALKRKTAESAEGTGIIAELDQKSVETVDFIVTDEVTPGMITSASVPKVGKLERAKRRVKASVKKTSRSEKKA